MKKKVLVTGGAGFIGTNLINQLVKEDMDVFSLDNYSTGSKENETGLAKYIKGDFVLGLSRGDGKTGEDITNNLRTIKDIPKKISKSNFPKILEVRGEVYISKKEFKNISNKFSNPRNAAGGSLRQKNSEETKKIPLKFLAYSFGFVEPQNFYKQSEYLKFLKEWGFNVSPFNKLVSNIKEIEENHKAIEGKRSVIDYDLDGLVYKVDDLKLQKRLGFITRKNLEQRPSFYISMEMQALRAEECLWETGLKESMSTMLLLSTQDSPGIEKNQLKKEL